GDWDAEAELGGLEASPARSFARPADPSLSPPIALARTDHPSVGSADGCGAPSAFGARRATVPPYFNSLLRGATRRASGGAAMTSTTRAERSADCPTHHPIRERQSNHDAR